jgi:hypothetical protein
METEGEEDWEEEQHASDVSILIDLANDMHAIVQDQNAHNGHEEGTENDGLDSPE